MCDCLRHLVLASLPLHFQEWLFWTAMNTQFTIFTLFIPTFTVITMSLECVGHPQKSHCYKLCIFFKKNLQLQLILQTFPHWYPLGYMSIIQPLNQLTINYPYSQGLSSIKRKESPGASLWITWQKVNMKQRHPSNRLNEVVPSFPLITPQ